MPFLPLLSVYAGVGAGYLLGRAGVPSRLAGAAGWHGDPVRLLSQAVFLVFIPALLFRTTARIDAAGLPWGPLAAYFLPASCVLLGVAAWTRWRQAHRPGSVDAAPEAPMVTGIASVFSNNAQLGIPVAAALFGEAGLALHLAITAVHALVLMTQATVGAEAARAHAAGRAGGGPGLAGVVAQTVRRAVIHPVVLPVLAGLAWNATGWPLPPVLDTLLLGMATVAVPLCLLLIGLSMAEGDARAAVRGALGLIALKLLLLPAAVAVVAGGVFGLRGLPLQVLVMAAALPAGANALLFAQRYRVLEAQVAATVAGSTLLYAATAPAWLLLLRSAG
jgi:hypothetical protein